MSKFKIVLLVLSQFIPSHLAFSQQPDLKFQHFTSADGLPSEWINTIIQDRFGFLWFGMNNGLVRYDGYEFKVYHHDENDPNSFSGNYVTSVNEDVRGDLWITTTDGGLNKFDRRADKFIHFRNDPHDSTTLSSNDIITSYLDKSGFLWIVFTDSLLDKVDTQTGGITQYRHDPDDSLSISSNYISYGRISHKRWPRIFEDSQGDIWIGTYGGGVDRYNHDTDAFIRYQHDDTDENSLSNDGIGGIFEDSQKIIWVGTWGGGLNRYVRETDSFVHYRHDKTDPNSLGNDRCLNIFEDSTNNLWISVEGGLDYFDRASERFTHYRYNESELHGLSNAKYPTHTYLPIFEDETGLIWIISKNGATLDMFDPQSRQFYHYREDANNPQGIRAIFYSSILKDSFGILWLGTSTRGVNKLDQLTQSFTNFRHRPRDKNSLSANTVSSILQSKVNPDIIWIGTTAGLNQYNRRTNDFTLFKHDPTNINSLVNNRVNSLCEDKDGNLWIGTAWGLSRYAPDGEFTNYKHNPEDASSLSVNGVFTLYIDRAGVLWVGTYNGLNRYNEKSNTFTRFLHDPTNPKSIANKQVWSVYEDVHGRLWIGTPSGLDRFESQDQSFKHFLTGMDVFGLTEDRNNNFWVAVFPGNGLGLFERNTGEITFYNKEQGLPNNKIDEIIEDDKGFLWLCTEGGLSKFDPQTKVFTNFYKQQGLPTNILHGGGTKLDDGHIFASTMFDGVVTFDPEDIKINIVPPKMVVNHIRLFNESLPIAPNSPLKQEVTFTKEIEFEHWQNDISLECTALHYRAPQLNQYAFWMEGQDKDWYNSGTDRVASYTNLEPGEYIFHAKGANSDGVWSEEQVMLRIIIHPPWWATWWAYTIYGCIIFGLLYGLRRYELNRQNLKHSWELKRVEAENYQEIDKMKSRFFANISHEFRTPLTLIKGPIQQMLSGDFSGNIKRQYQMILRNTNRLMQLINQLLDLSKLTSGEMVLKTSSEDIDTLVNGLTQSFESLAKQKNIELQFQSSEDEIIVYIDRDKFEKIIINLLSNALKFTPDGGFVSVSIAHSLDKISEGNEFAEIKISNSGEGIAPDKLDKIFDRFYQVDDSSIRRHEGTGIGLSLTKELVELHSGKITVESERGKETTFTVYLPLGKDHLQPEEIIETPAEILSDLKIDSDRVGLTFSTEEKTETTSNQPSKDSSTLLIVEDNADMRNYMRKSLESNYKIIEAENGEEGIRQSLEHSPDMIISDVMMPKMDGFQFCTEIKKDGRTSHIPVILLTAKASGESKIEGLETGADDYLTKPFDNRELQVRIKNLIEQRKKLQEKFRKDFTVSPRDITVTSIDEKLVQKAIDVVEKNISERDFDTAIMAKEVGISRMLLNTKLKALTGLPTGEFIRTLRLKRAAQLLQQGHGNVTQVAYDVGFQSLSYFAKAFRKQFGQSPSYYSTKNVNNQNQ